MEKFAFQDFSLKSRNRERWKPISGFEDYYEISSQGRIKSLERAWELPNGGNRIKLEHILSQRVTRKYNKNTKDYYYGFVVALYVEGVAHCFSVARLVYDAFVSSFDLEDKSILISFKDGNFRNLDYKNLEALSPNRIRKRMYERGRNVIETKKTICQFDFTGKFIAQYTSISEAGHKNGYDISSIAAVVRKGGLFKGFLWQEGKSTKLKGPFLPKGIELGINPSFASENVNSYGKVLPIANLSLKNMKGEQWKDFPSYEGLYQISNKGRIKALSKVSEGKLKKWMPERIRKHCPKVKKGGLEGRNGTLITTLSKNGKKQTYTVARYMYCLFVRKFDLFDKNIRILYKDGNSYNLDPGNLYIQKTAH